MAPFKMLKPKLEDKMYGGWSAQVEVNGVPYWVSLRRGHSVGRHFGHQGYVWYAHIRNGSQNLWTGRVYKGIPLAKLLKISKLIPCGHEKSMPVLGLPFRDCRICGNRFAVEVTP